MKRPIVETPRFVKKLTPEEAYAHGHSDGYDLREYLQDQYEQFQKNIPHMIFAKKEK